MAQHTCIHAFFKRPVFSASGNLPLSIGSVVIKELMGYLFPAFCSDDWADETGTAIFVFLELFYNHVYDKYRTKTGVLLGTFYLYLSRYQHPRAKHYQRPLHQN